MAPRYSLYYWPIPFRGHFIRYALAHAGVEWDEATYDQVVALKNAPPEEQPYPFMAPPLLTDHHTGLSLSQLPAILMDLGERHGMLADPPLTLRLICDACDILLEITRHHGEQLWDAGTWAEFAGARLPRWMRIHERLVTDAGGVYACGTAEPTLADLVLAALWHTMIDRLPPLRPLLHANAPELERLADRIAATPRVAAMLADWTDRRPLYCAGQIEASLLEVLEMDD